MKSREQAPSYKGYQPKMVELNLPHLSPDLTTTRDLVANTLASDPFSMVFSESPPPAAVLLHCPPSKCDRAKQVQIFRDVITLMGNSPVHKRLFFKLQFLSFGRVPLAGHLPRARHDRAFAGLQMACGGSIQCNCVKGLLDPAQIIRVE